MQTGHCVGEVAEGERAAHKSYPQGFLFPLPNGRGVNAGSSAWSLCLRDLVGTCIASGKGAGLTLRDEPRWKLYPISGGNKDGQGSAVTCSGIHPCSIGREDTYEPSRAWLDGAGAGWSGEGMRKRKRDAERAHMARAAMVVVVCEVASAHEGRHQMVLGTDTPPIWHPASGLHPIEVAFEEGRSSSWTAGSW